MSLEYLIVRLRKEEDNRVSENKGLSQVVQVKANIIELDSHPHKKRKYSGDYKLKGSKKFKGKYFNCDKMGHRKKDCRKKNQKKQANMIKIDRLSDGMNEMNLSIVISEVNIIGSNSKEQWIGIGATSHIYVDCYMFSTYEKIDKEEQLFMTYLSIAKVEGHRNIVLKLTSGKTHTLKDVLHTLNICKNLVFESLLSNKGFKLVSESDKFVLTKKGLYIRKRY